MTRTTTERPTAGVIVIGNEVLSGKVIERNIALFVQRFRKLGVDLQRVAIITDSLDDIAATVSDFSSRFDVVCTTGGIGPTHDDLTTDGVALGLDRETEVNATLMGLIEAHVTRTGGDVTPGHRRMARAPEGCELCGEARWPTVKAANVYIFPGVPALLARKFDALGAQHFRGAPVWTGELHATASESEVVAELNAVVARHADVAIGSYPQLLADGGWTLRITFEHLDRDAVTAAMDALAEALGARMTQREAPRSSDA